MQVSELADQSARSDLAVNLEKSCNVGRKRTQLPQDGQADTSTRDEC